MPSSRPRANDESSVTARCRALPSVCPHHPASNVYLRIKPTLDPPRVAADPAEETYALPDSTTLHVRRGENAEKRYSFTRIFDGETKQADFFYESVRRQVIHLLLGESSTVIAYGASNTGKTYTLYGTPEEPGAIPRSIELLFSAVDCTLAPWYKIADDNTVVALDEPERALEISNRTSLINRNVMAKEEYTQARLSLDNSNPRLAETEERDLWSDGCISSVWISVAEIYNDNVYDLLIGHEQERRPLKVTTRRDGSTFPNGLKFVHVATALEACQLLILVQSRMTVAAPTAESSNPSQSHTFFTLKLLKYEKENRPDTVRVSTLTFCDVAGSRRVKSRDEAGGCRSAAESRNINNSLLVLGRCLKTLRDSYSSGDHVAGPFRESKLTRILQKVLTGREKSSFVVTVDIGMDAFAETSSVLNFSAMAKRLGESRLLRRTAFSVTTPRKSSPLPLPALGHHQQATKRTIAIDSEVYERLRRENERLREEAELWRRGREEGVSRHTQSDVSCLDYDRLGERNRVLAERVHALEEGNLNREYEIRQELVDRYSVAIERLESCWRKRVQDVEDEGRDLLNWSVSQVESFYKERIDSLMRRGRAGDEGGGEESGGSKKRKREEGEEDRGMRRICEDLETENAMITSKVVVLRGMVRDLRRENELLVTGRNKCSFELALTKEKLKGFHDLIRAHFPELFAKIGDEEGDIGCLVYELKRMLDEKTEDIESLENNLSRASEDYVKMVTKTIDAEKELRETRSRLQEVLSRAKDFENEVKEKTDLANELQLQLQLLRKELVEIRECESGYVVTSLKSVEKGGPPRRDLTRKYVYSDDPFSSDNNSENNAELAACREAGGKADRCSYDDYDYDKKRVSLNAMESDVSDRHTFRSSDSGIKEDSGIDCTSHTLKRIADVNKSEVSECKNKLLSCEAKMAELEEENEKLTRMVEIDSRRYNERINELTEELLVKEEDDNHSLNKLENCLKKCAYLENQLAVLHLVHERTVKYFSRRQKAEHAAEIDEILEKDMGGEGNSREGARHDLLRLQQLRERIDEFEIVLEKCKEERNNYRAQLQQQLETQSILETKLKWLSTEIRSRDDELISLKMEMDGVAVVNDENDEKVKSLGEEIGRSCENVRRVRERLTYFEETRKNLEETLADNVLDPRTSYPILRDFTRAKKTYRGEGESNEVCDELCTIKLQLRENEREMISLKKHRNDMVKKYECTVQRLRIEIERMRKKLINLQKLLLTNFAWRYRKLLNRRNERCIIFQLEKLTSSNDRDWILTRIKKRVSDEELPIVERSIASPRYADSQSSVRNEEFDTIGAYESEESYQTESSLGLNEWNVDGCQIQSDASDCSEVQCSCGIGFKNAGRHGRMSGWMKVRRSCANTCLLRQLDGTRASVEQG
ncbi:kinesin-like protein KIF20B [Apis laboriosa]|uniref:kinesin-like protein KIF20B n=1 Tax=Apis laboriosa TaxID=183418 RepID=UPI001CC5DB3A|nr:kinesin-like protein KIF20B [Apis laboriosa]